MLCSWTGSTGAGYDAYDRSHVATTDPATVALAMSSDPAFGGDPSLLDPEQLLVLVAGDRAATNRYTSVIARLA